MGLRQFRRRATGTAVPAGLVDSGLSALSTFLVGLAAVRYLDLQALGAYALAHVAFLLGNALPTMLVLMPAQVQSIAEADGDTRLTVVRSSGLPGVALGVLSGGLVAAATLVVPSEVPLETRLGFALSLVLVCAVSPVQDHLRGLLHAAGRSWGAAVTSQLQLTSVAIGLTGCLLTGSADSPLAPFGVLAAANVISGGYALVLCLRVRGRVVRLRHGAALRLGSPLLLGSLTSFLGGFISVAVITAAAGAEAAALLEAVRLMAQPASVVLVGVLAVIAPLLLRAVADGDAAAGRRLLARWCFVAAVVTVPYAVLLGLPWEGNPLRLLVPRAFEDRALLATMVVSQAIAYAGLAFHNVPLAARRGNELLAVQLAGTAIGVTVVVWLAERGAWGAVIGAGVASVVMLLLLIAASLRLLRRLPPATLASLDG